MINQGPTVRQSDSIQWDRIATRPRLNVPHPKLSVKGGGDKGVELALVIIN